MLGSMETATGRAFTAHVSRVTKRGAPLASPKTGLSNRILEWRLRRDLSQGALGAKVGLTHSQVGKIERDEAPLDMLKLRAFADALNVAAENLITGGPDVSVAVRYSVRAADSPGHDPELARPWSWMTPPPGLGDPDGCFVAVVEDDSADRLYRPGAILWVRRLVVPSTLQVREKVLIRRFADPRTQETRDVLVGMLERGVAGDIQVSLRTSNRALAGAVPVRQSRLSPGLSDRYAEAAAASAPIEYQPMTGDDAEILGVVEWATTRE